MSLFEIIALPLNRLEYLYEKLTDRRRDEAKNIQSAYRSKKPM